MAYEIESANDGTDEVFIESASDGTDAVFLADVFIESASDGTGAVFLADRDSRLELLRGTKLTLPVSVKTLFQTVRALQAQTGPSPKPLQKPAPQP